MLDCQNISIVALSHPEKLAKRKHRYPGYTNHDILNSQVAPSMFDLWSQFIYNSAEKKTLHALITSQGRMLYCYHGDNVAPLKKHYLYNVE